MTGDLEAGGAGTAGRRPNKGKSTEDLCWITEVIENIINNIVTGNV